MNIVTVVTKILIFQNGFSFLWKIINLKKDRFSTAAKLDVLSILQNPTILQIIHYRWVRQDCMLPQASYQVDTVTEESFIWPDNNSGVSHTLDDVLCMPYHVFLCNHQLGIVRCMVNLPLTYAGGSKAILMKLLDFLQQEWTLSVIPTRRPPSKTQGPDFATP